jgi:hypothetical protein
MSKGLGRIQRQVLEELAREQPLTTFQLAARIYDCPIDADGLPLVADAQLVAVRRALLGFQRKGTVSGHRGFHDRRARWFVKGSDQEPS